MTIEDKPTFEEIMKNVSLVFNMDELSSKVVANYFEDLKDMTIEQVQEGALEIFKNDKYYPMPLNFRGRRLMYDIFCFRPESIIENPLMWN